jgi:glyoxylase-like metal-dependent hydrolase (beta-lactamase superfamily II)
VGEAGRTDLPGGNLPCLIDSIRIKILPLDKKTVIFPGHHRTGDPSWSTLEQEMKTNIYITDFILDEP